ncbi:aminodeoxychorismate synthase component I [Henriciella sp.]|uniref:aminodeoxychorismate synthase component I n=1 Tax=Henriciella sp. TaxID=1968823 RepID=UPI00261B9557|nr:aminodeoxychorismate synthase component I [Henriciella sp.]
MRVLIIDNYDSFTYNLAELVAAASGTEPVVLLNDAITPAELQEVDFDAAILSPGPGHPARPHDFGLCATLLRDTEIPVLGVCLGHQGIALLAGGKVSHAPEPMHGRLSAIAHAGEQLFENIPSPFNAVRYHSLIAQDLPESLAADAWSEDGLVMGLHHRDLPRWGVQFHPESVATDHGAAIIRNFLRLAGSRLARPPRPGTMRRTAPTAQPDVRPLKLVSRKLETGLKPETCFERLYATSPDAFWLDSSSHHAGQGRYSFMGDAQGPLAETVSYDVAQRRVEVITREGTYQFDETIFDYLERQTASVYLDDNDTPLPFKGGYVGYLGYELKADCGGRNTHESPHRDAQLVFADRFLAFDHETGEAWLACLVPSAEETIATEWFASVKAAMTDEQPRSVARQAPAAEAGHGSSPAWSTRHTRKAYLDRIATSLDRIRDGESYEICLCNEWRRPYGGDPLSTYQSLRELNPAPYGAYLKFGGLSVLSCSPERMVRIAADGQVECKPIKGTIGRGRTGQEDAALKARLAASEKDRAENLMIVDLIRNDLNRVCRTGSVRVPKLYDIESFTSVHQMVSTVTGQLREDESAVSCIRSLFPGGSMTGAPKVRTMEIIDSLEAGPRGVYSGAIGYISLDGAVDLNIVIRTAVLDSREASIGAGGAIIALSDPHAEFDETMLKGELLRKALDAFEQRDSHNLPAPAEKQA